ncbi:major facilitator superfamily domain-containing protein [Amanita rubescens]|nr:major facilitator superfamily domain-containing protein [Amanita rubescens]
MSTASHSSSTLRDESCPLLRDQSDSELEAQKAFRVTPLPKFQLATLCISRMIDPIAFTQVFPYINEFLASLHVADNDPSRIGFYSGIVESSYAVVQLCWIYQWAKLSDIIGRRPIIIGAPLGIALTTLSLGLSTTYGQILASRCLAGIFSANSAVIVSAIGEVTDSTNQILAFPIFGLCWPLGGIIGPLIGGLFSKPAERFPELFDWPFMRRHPYFLPCLVSASISLMAAISAFLFLDETLPKKCAKKLQPSYGTSQESTEPELDRVFTMRDLLSIPSIRALCASSCALSFIATGFDVLFVLFCYTPISSGGLGFSTSQIGYSLAIAGVISVLIQILILPSLLSRFNNAKLYNFFMLLWPFAFAVLPFLNSIAVNNIGPSTGTIGSYVSTPLWIGIAIVLSLARTSCLAFSVNMILVKDNVPNPSSLGATNGLVQFFMCLSRALSPAFVSTAFSWSLKKDILGGHMWVVVMILISILGYTTSKRIPCYSLTHQNI